jgi:peptidoglycan hydrolase CwlO-like protein
MRLAATALVAGLLFGVGMGAVPTTARASEDSDLQAKVEQTSKSYNDAVDHLNKVQKSMDDNQAKIDQLNEELPKLRESAAKSINSSYKLSQSSGGVIDMLLSADNFNELVSAMNYLDIVAGKNNDAMDKLVSAQEKLQETQDTLKAQKAEAETAKDNAKSAMDDAIAARKEAQEQAAKELAAQRAEAQKAVEEAQKAEKDGQTTFKTESGNTATVTTPTAGNNNSTSSSSSSSNNSSNGSSSSGSSDTSNTSAVTWTARDKFVQEWTGRINAYLAGSPMAGHGKTFAEAAYDSGVDPRYSPAIANVESSKGLYCFKPYNAWGWGSSGFSDWDSAIRAHVAGLASGYGYTVSVTAAKKYCPPNWQFWYSAVLSNMNSI